MDNNFLEVVSTLTERKANSFMVKTDSNVSSVIHIKQVIKDLSWLDMLEEMIPYIDTIVRNPRKFIVQEEEIIPVEKTKKVTEESIKHLAKHTSLIQDIDKDGDVKPLKLLNVFKEETTDLYENRFIFSLIINVKTFLNNILEKDDGSLKSNYLKTVNFRSETTIPGEIIKFNIGIQNEYTENSEDEAVKKENTEERIKRIVEIFNDFLSTQFIKGLQGATPVRSPIRKTNVILKDKNFQKAVELWEFIERFDIESSTKLVETSKVEEVHGLAEKMIVGAYLQYSAANSVNKKDEDIVDFKFSTANLRKIIEAYVVENHTEEKAFKQFLNEEFKRAKEKKENEYEEIKSIFKSNITRHKTRLNNADVYLR